VAQDRGRNWTAVTSRPLVPRVEHFGQDDVRMRSGGCQRKREFRSLTETGGRCPRTSGVGVTERRVRVARQGGTSGGNMRR